MILVFFIIDSNFSTSTSTKTYVLLILIYNLLACYFAKFSTYFTVETYTKNDFISENSSQKCLADKF